MEKNSVEKYLIHCSGVYSMLAWMEEQTSVGTGIDYISNQTIYVPLLGARYFAIGTSKHKKAKLPFLAIQPNESQWLKLIEWDYIATQINSNYLYVISKVVPGDQIEYPDIPAFALAIPFDQIEKLSLLKNIQKIDGREYFIETNGAVKINYHSKLFTLPVKNFSDEEEYLPNQKITNYNDLMRDREEVLQSVFTMGVPPEFKGEIADIPESKGLFKKLKDKLL